MVRAENQAECPLQERWREREKSQELFSFYFNCVELQNPREMLEIQRMLEILWSMRDLQV